METIDYAKAMADPGADMTRTGSILGTAKYLAPEVVEGNELDARADVYALGVVLYELLTGERPYGAALQNRASTELAAVQFRPPSPPACCSRSCRSSRPLHCRRRPCPCNRCR